MNYKKLAKKSSRQYAVSASDANLGGIGELPKDLLVEILVRLPLQSILRCKIISKAWNHLISDKSFPKNRASNSGVTHLLCHRLEAVKNQKLANFFTVSVHDIFDKDDDEPSPIANPTVTAFELKFPLQQGERIRTFNPLDSCNGLVLCSIGLMSLFVVNPSNKTWLPLPAPPSSYHQFLDEDLNGMALAFDPKFSDHFEVVCPIFPSEIQLILLIYSSKTGFWSASETVKFEGLTFVLQHVRVDSMMSNGVLYMETYHLIIRIGIDNLAADLIYFPNNVMSSSNCVSHLGMLKGCLQWCQIFHANERIHVWELQDTSTSRWSCKHILPFQFLFDPLNRLCLSRYSLMEVYFHPYKYGILLRIGMNQIVYYELESGKKKVIVLEDCVWSSGLLQLSPCFVNLFELQKETEKANT